MSNIIGSRKSQTIIYIVADNIQVVCGCYRTNAILDFEKRVKEVHKDSKQYLKEYLDFIKIAKIYIKYIN